MQEIRPNPEKFFKSVRFDELRGSTYPANGNLQNEVCSHLVSETIGGEGYQKSDFPDNDNLSKCLMSGLMRYHMLLSG